MMISLNGEQFQVWNEIKRKVVEHEPKAADVGMVMFKDQIKCEIE